MEKTYTMTGTQIMKVFEKWVTDYKGDPKSFVSIDKADPTNQAEQFIVYLEEIQR